MPLFRKWREIERILLLPSIESHVWTFDWHRSIYIYIYIWPWPILKVKVVQFWFWISRKWWQISLCYHTKSRIMAFNWHIFFRLWPILNVKVRLCTFLLQIYRKRRQIGKYYNCHKYCFKPFLLRWPFTFLRVDPCRFASTRMIQWSCSCY